MYFNSISNTVGELYIFLLKYNYRVMFIRDEENTQYIYLTHNIDPKAHGCWILSLPQKYPSQWSPYCLNSGE